MIALGPTSITLVMYQNVLPQLVETIPKIPRVLTWEFDIHIILFST